MSYSQQKILDAWFKPLPLEEYCDLVKDNIPENIPKTDSCPKDYRLGRLDIACGPLVRFLASHENNSNNYRGSIMIVVRNIDDGIDVPTLQFVIGPSVSDGTKEHSIAEEAPIDSKVIYKEQNFTFIRYSFMFQLKEFEQRVRYSIDGDFKQHFQFFLPSSLKSMNVMSYSCNGFSLAVETESFKSSLWLDVLRKHNQTNFHYHVMVGGGDQIYADSVKNSSTELAKWLKHKHLHAYEKSTPEMVESLNDFYLNHYIKWFGKGYWEGINGKTIQAAYPIALSTIPQINIFDDHDIIDGYGSYKDITMRQDIFKTLGQRAFFYYMLFQHHTHPDEPTEPESSWIMGKKPGPYINQLSRSVFAKLGRNIGFLGMDNRTERTKKQVVMPETYDAIFNRLEDEVSKSESAGKPLKHLYVLLGVPICYPRMVFLERLASSPLARPLKFLARHGVIARGLVNEFDGEIELLDDMEDHWCSHHHKKERNALMKRLIAFGHEHSIRITILSGDVHLCCISRFRDDSGRKSYKSPENDPSFIINLISSAIVNVAPPDGMAKFLSYRTKEHIFESFIKEDMVPLFELEPASNKKRATNMFMNKRNYADLVPVENISTEYKSERFGVDTANKYFVPGAVDGPSLSITYDENKHESSKTNGKIGYPFDEDGILATLHVEVDHSDVSSKTGDYDFVVPSLKLSD